MSQKGINNASMLRKGTVLRGIYRIDSYLSSGGFGNTYVATNIEFDEQVAIKEFFMKGVTQRDGNQTTVSVSNSENKDSFLEQREKFKKEARRIRQLKNEHIVTVHDLFDENGTSYYVMDYVDGENLSERLKRTGRAMTESEVRLILPHILDALKAVHEAGIWHLDLKPANIMMDKDGKVKLIDFGASKQLNAQKGGATTGTAVSYTNGYAPREQMEQNFDKFGPWTDIYALGATLYTLLTNQRPPLPTDIDDDISEDKHVALPLPESVSDNLKSLVLQLLQTNRNLRPQSVDELLVIVKTISGNNSESFDEVHEDSTIEEDEHFLDENTTLSTDNSDNTAFKKELLEKAQNGDAESQTTLGLCFFSGSDGFPLDYSKAFEWFAKAAEQGDPCAQNHLGNCYNRGSGTSQDYNKAIEWYSKAAEQGDEAAKMNLEELRETLDLSRKLIVESPVGKKQPKERINVYFLGLLLIAIILLVIPYCLEKINPIDYTTYNERLVEAAESGDAKAQDALGSVFYDGIGVNQDFSKAVEWWTRSAEQDNANAQFNLATCYCDGEGVDKNLQTAFSWYSKAAEQENDLAQNKLGICYAYGLGVDKNLQEAVGWFTKAAEQGYANAQYNLGLSYYKGEGVEQDYAKAIEWYTKAAEQGDADAQYNLGLLYFDGEGVEKDYDKAVEWIKKAAEQGDAVAQYNLGVCYDNGYGVSQDMVKAVEWYTKAAEQGDADAQYNLGICYYNGDGISQDKVKALEWIRKAAEQGNANARNALNRLK